MNNGLLTLTNPSVVYATTMMNMSHSQHRAEMHHNPANATMSEEDKKRFCGNDKINSNQYVNEFAILFSAASP